MTSGKFEKLSEYEKFMEQLVNKVSDKNNIFYLHSTKIKAKDQQNNLMYKH